VNVSLYVAVGSVRQLIHIMNRISIEGSVQEDKEEEEKKKKNKNKKQKQKKKKITHLAILS